ncbi:MAG: hypothetical protein KBT20_05345 [Bacteroidales bacterium]|nr:hypothetical protein [Candidatus Liminaster caballi]
MKHLLLFALILSLFFSCNNDSSSLKELDRIKIIGNSDPTMGLLNDYSIVNESDYVKAKYDLLQIRLRDKADIIPSSADSINQLVTFFKTNGTDLDLQEVYYYAGSTYRDLHDYPRAIEFFLYSANIAERMEDTCDSILLRNTYSNLSYAYGSVQDYHNYLEYSKKECDFEAKLYMISSTGLTHLAHAYFLADSLSQSMALFDSILAINAVYPDVDNLSTLLYIATCQGDNERVSQCADIIKSAVNDIYQFLGSQSLFLFGWSYYISGNLDSAKICYRTVLEREDDLEAIYDASKWLFRLYLNENKEKDALDCALRFTQICDTLNFGKRQEMAATITNIYKYNRDKEEEQRIKTENMEYHNWIIRVIMIAIILLLSIIGYVLIVKNRHLKKTIRLNGVINHLNSELEVMSKELTETELISNERLSQNQTLVKLLHQTEMEKTSKEIITALRQTSIGRRHMSNEDWRLFYSAVDKLYPSFKDTLLQKLDKYTEEKMQVCYLMRIGFSKSEIQNITGLSRATVWRWSKTFSWIEDLLSAD